MSRRRKPRVPSTLRVLLVLPEIRDEWPTRVKNGIAIRNACATDGICPNCGTVGEPHQDASHRTVMHLVFRHEAWCAVIPDEVAA